jgi:hypothetical protein
MYPGPGHYWEYLGPGGNGNSGAAGSQVSPGSGAASLRDDGRDFRRQGLAGWRPSRQPLKAAGLGSEALVSTDGVKGRGDLT